MTKHQHVNVDVVFVESLEYRKIPLWLRSRGYFYVRFKDLRDDTFIYFRGFVTGITENVTPTFNPISYVGRSEDVYIYQKGERDLSFNLKISQRS